MRWNGLGAAVGLACLVGAAWGEEVGAGAPAALDLDAAIEVGQAHSGSQSVPAHRHHRVVGADGSLTGYAGGVEHKRWLLDHETDRRGLFNCRGSSLPGTIHPRP